MPVIVRTLVVIALLALNGFFVAAEFALLRARRTRLEAMTRAGVRGSRLALRATAQLDRVLSACQLGITATSLGLGFTAATMLADALGAWLGGLPGALQVSLRASLGATLALLLVVYLHVVFGEFVPRALARLRPERAARWLAPPVLALAWATAPAIWLLQRSADLVLRLLGQDPQAREERVHSPDELRLLVEHSQARGALARRDAEFLEGVFAFSSKTARDVMTPRTRLVAMPAEATLEEALAIVEEGGFSRYPVYEGNVDGIVGVVLAKDLLRVVATRTMGDPNMPFALAGLIRPAHVVPGTRGVQEILADFKRLKEHLAIVFDEFGGVEGVVTMEDLLEEIVGEILDEYDEAEPAGTNAVTGQACVQGAMHVSEVNERFGLAVPDVEYTTIGGYVFGTLGRLPALGDRISAGGAIFTVRELEGRRIASLDVDLHTLGDRRGSARSPEEPEAPASPGKSGSR